MKKPTGNLMLRRLVAVAFGQGLRMTRPRFALVSTMPVTAIGLILAQPAIAAISCPAASSSASTTVTCTIDSSQGGSGAQVNVNFTGNAGTGTNIGDYGGNYTVINDGAVLNPTQPQAGIFVRLTGGAGSSDTSNNGTNGGNGGTVNITNSGSITVNTQPTSNAQGSGPGIWADSGAQFGIYGVSVGGVGANAGDTVIGGGNGGAGGAGSQVTINNTSSINVQSAPYGGVGIYGASVGGLGGNQDNAASGDQVGGNGGASNLISITNSGAVTVSSGSAGRYAWGIGAESIGGNGGQDNGSGQSAGVANDSNPTIISNSGNVQVSINGSSSMTNGARGLYILSQGGNGFASEDGSDNGGTGGQFGNITVVNSGPVTVNSTSVPEPTTLSALSGGIVMLQVGGNGGLGPQTIGNTTDEIGGYGGGSTAHTATATLNSGSSVTTSGDYLPGVNVVSQGGNGGAGREDSNGAVGGGGGAIVVNMSGSTSISTNGIQSYGIAARSFGGAGGGVETSSGIIDFTPENAGSGGAGGTVSVTTGNASSGLGGGTITTSGDYSIGIFGQSMGGIGGTTTGNFELFGNAGTDAGIGGASGSVAINSMSAITTYGQSSHGISAQAIGGGGGTAGASGGIIAVGGDGGTAVAGGTVTVTQNGNLATNGTAAMGILAQSIGGGGGDGGSANGVAVVGGQGGGGGAGGSATVNLAGGTLSTGGDNAYGIVAQSIGGGGGTGGAASSYDASVGFAMSVAIGGTGGNGGSGVTAAVNVSNANIVTGFSGTTATDAHGLVVQSIGGGGGAGGASVAKALAVAVPDEDASFGVAVTFAMGGTGASGGVGGAASASLTNGSITTYGANSQGAIVQSIGGGGGIGGNATATSTVVGTGGSVGGTVQSSVGGSGGAGMYGGTASITLQGSTITTWGDSANAILVQSIGGGGGAGGIGSATGRSANTDANLSITANVGGVGNAGGNGSSASLTIDPTSTVITHGDGAHAVIVQSIGGGGGASQGGQVGLALASSSEDSSTDVTGNVSIGRSGANGGSGGAITLNSDGNITTYGSDADGLLVQSIGGSGGLGGAVGGISTNSSSAESLGDSGTSYKLNVSVGGTGGAGGVGGTIGTSSAPASLGANIQTFGDYADAAVLQSIGGGGGAGGASTASSSISSADVSLSVGGRGGSGGNGGPITAFLNGDGFNNFDTQGYGAMGIVLQSIGGGGGMAGTGSPLAHGALSAGGSTAGVGGDITVTSASYAAISTKGDSAYGLVVQSIGGGGGIAMAGSTASTANPGSQQFDLSAGGSSSSNAGTIDLSTGLNLSTTGARAIGVLAQSIGGGGGVVTTGAANGVGTIALGGNNAGAGGSVTLNLNYTLSTAGAGAHGVVAQSIGGGGGIVGDTSQPIQFNATGFHTASPSGNGGAVSVSYNGSLATSGANAHGIVAQSIGGGGGLAGGPQGGFAGSVAGANGNGNTVSVTQAGTLVAGGAGSAGIFAQSQGPIDQAAVSVTVNGSVQGGSGSGSGVWISAGKHNQLTVNAGGSVSALSGVAVRYDGDSTTDYGSLLNIDNYGNLQGSVICGNTDSSTACTLTNHTGAVSSDAVTYNADVSNDGLIVIGKPGQFQTLNVTGNLTQSSGGVLRADVDFDKMQSSRLVVQGNANLAGSVDALPQALLPNRELTVLTVQGSTQGAVNAVDSPVYNYETRQVGQDTRIRVASADFNAPSMGLKENQSHVADNLQRIWDAGGNFALAPLFAQLDLASRQGAGAYRDSVANLSPGVTVAPAVQSTANMGQFTGSMMSCPAFTGVDAMTGEQNCFWGQVTGRSTNQDGSKGITGFDYDTITYQFGGQREVSPGWFVGGSMAYENSHVRASDGSVHGNGDSGYAGAVVKRQEGPWVFAAAFAGGYGGYQMDRDIDIAGYQDTLTSRPDVYGFNARLRAARTFAYSNMYVKPYLDLDASYTRMPGYHESGSNPLALSVDGSDQFILGLSPMIEFGGRSELKNGAMLRPFVYAGVSFLSQDDWTSHAHLRGAPDGTGSFNTSLPIDNVIGKLGAGLQVTNAGGIDFRLQYDGQFSEHVRSNSATLKVMVPF
jgi:hypothetical protein